MRWSSHARRSLVNPAIGVALAQLVACGEPELTCAELDLTCAPLYAPTFDNVYVNTLAMKCGDDRSACHSDAGRAGDLSLADPLTAYEELTDPTRRLVLTEDVGCGSLVARVYTSEETLVMPVGSPMSEPERCAIAQWVAAGAPGPSAELLARFR